MSAIWPAAEPSRLLVLSAADLQRLLEREALITAMAEAMRAYSTGGALAPLRTMMRLPGDAVRILASMPGYLAGGSGPAASPAASPTASSAASPTASSAASNDALGAKLVSVYPANAARGLESHYGLVVVFEPETGRPRAVMDGTFVTTARTAAVSAVSVNLLARSDATVLAVIGAGVQARAHLWALAGVRPFREARLYSRTSAHARALAESAAPHVPFRMQAIGSAAAAVEGADVVVTATSAATPVLERRWLRPGAHIVAVGASTPAARELDSQTVRDALLVVDSRTGALNEAGDVLAPLQEGLIGPEHIQAELGELLAGTKPGRTHPEQITLYKSLGLAVQDVAAARLALERALATGAGAWVEM